VQRFIYHKAVTINIRKWFHDFGGTEVLGVMLKSILTVRKGKECGYSIRREEFAVL